jgi:hypothetical protein
MCKDGPGMYAHLYRYDVASDTWQQEIRQRQLLFMAPLPHAGGVLLQERVQLSGMRNIIWENGVQREGFAQPLRGSIFRADPVAGPDERMLVYAYDFSARQSHFRLLNLTACDESGCELIPLDAPPVWSPDGGASLLWQQRNAILLGDEQGQMARRLAQGAAPFWLDETTRAGSRPMPLSPPPCPTARPRRCCPCHACKSGFRRPWPISTLSGRGLRRRKTAVIFSSWPLWNPMTHCGVSTASFSSMIGSAMR